MEFCNFKWIGISPLHFQYPTVFATVANPKCTTGYMGFLGDSRWMWNLELIIDGLSGETSSQFAVMLDILRPIKLVPQLDDVFVWWKGGKCFSVHISYKASIEVNFDGQIDGG